MQLSEFLRASLTPFHAVETAKKLLLSAGFSELADGEIRDLESGKGYFVRRNESSLVAFRVGRILGENFGFRIVAAHTDSPALKLKYRAESATENCIRLNVEVYGGMLQYTWFDRPLKVAGRAVVKDRRTGALREVLAESGKRLVIPSVAIHFNRDANKGFAVNAQTDLQPLAGLTRGFLEEMFREIGEREGAEVVESDLFAVCDQEPFLCGKKDEFLCAPRIDDLVSAFASLKALLDCEPEGVAVAALFDNEEVGSRTAQGAGGRFLRDTLLDAAKALGMAETGRILRESFFVSCDGAHAVHPNHPELSDPTNKVLLGGGIVIKHHAGGNYTTDALSSAVFKEIARRAEVPVQDFFMRSDLPCGGTLGAISSAQLSIKSVDIGVAQLAMHSAAETVAVADCESLERGLAAFYQIPLSFGEEIKIG